MHLSAPALFSAPYPPTPPVHHPLHYVVLRLPRFIFGRWRVNNGTQIDTNAIICIFEGSTIQNLYIRGVGSRMTSLWKGLSEIWRPAFDPEAVASACKKIKFLSISIWFYAFQTYFIFRIQLPWREKWFGFSLRRDWKWFGFTPSAASGIFNHLHKRVQIYFSFFWLNCDRIHSVFSCFILMT